MAAWTRGCCRRPCFTCSWCWARALGEAALWSAAFGVIAYSVYDLTNYATLQGFPLKVVVIDMIWGGIICGAAGAAMHLSTRA
jgi:uncharacterized membrane protein